MNISDLFPEIATMTSEEVLKKQESLYQIEYPKTFSDFILPLESGKMSEEDQLELGRMMRAFCYNAALRDRLQQLMSQTMQRMMPTILRALTADDDDEDEVKH